MPAHDPVPGPKGSMKRRFWRIFRLLLILSAVIAAIAVVVVNAGDSELHINMLVATALGVFFTTLLGTALMSLVFLSNESGHDEAAGAAVHYKEDE